MKKILLAIVSVGVLFSGAVAANDLKPLTEQQKIDLAQDLKISGTNGRISRVEHQMMRMDDRLRGGIANATAMASLVAPSYSGENHMAVGVGGFDGANSIAVGYTRHITENVSAKLTYAYGSEAEASYGASVGLSW